MLGTTPQTASLVFLLLLAPVAFYVCWTDLRWMKIRNRTGLLVLAIFAVAGGLVLPPEIWAWRWLNAVVVLAIGFFLTVAAGVGAGDAKYAAAVAPFVAPAHAALLLPIFAAFLLGAFAAHRGLRALPVVRAATPDWVSWTRADFPMGLAISGTIVTYLALTAFPEQAAALLNR
ncbi:A24 family peptidase [Frigidibacter sp. MR17.14]|uniref:A24 family peptidase n=1 Tax=Frigidibacter sp. MR17.14 TaxID=3126509 RepID=UPI003012A9A1